MCACSPSYSGAQSKLQQAMTMSLQSSLGDTVRPYLKEKKKGIIKTKNQFFEIIKNIYRG